MPKIGDIPKLREEILDMGRAKLAAPPENGLCKHAVLGPKIATWDTTGTSIKPFDIHNCKECGTTKSVRTFEWPELG